MESRALRGWILAKHIESDGVPELYSISRLRETAPEAGIDVLVVKPEQIDIIISSENGKSIRLNGEAVPLPDFLLPRMGSGTTYFALAVIRHLERLRVKVFNKSAGIEAVKDKLYTQQVLAASNLPYARTMLVKFPVNVDLVEKVLGFPVVVKTISGSRGDGVFLSENRAKFEDLMKLVRATRSHVNMILQEYVSTSSGRDLRVIAIGGRAICCMKRTSRGGSFKANFSAGGSVERFDLTPEIEWLAAETSRVFDLDIAGVDLLFDGDHFKICEVNSSPGFKGMELCQEKNVAREIFEFIKLRAGGH